MSEWIGEYCGGKILKSVGSLSRMGHVDAAGFIYLSDLGTRDMTELLRLYFLYVYIFQLTISLKLEMNNLLKEWSQFYSQRHKKILEYFA